MECRAGNMIPKAQMTASKCPAGNSSASASITCASTFVSNPARIRSWSASITPGARSTPVTCPDGPTACCPAGNTEAPSSGMYVRSATRCEGGRGDHPLAKVREERKDTVVGVGGATEEARHRLLARLGGLISSTAEIVRHAGDVADRCRTGEPRCGDRVALISRCTRAGSSGSAHPPECSTPAAPALEMERKILAQPTKVGVTPSPHSRRRPWTTRPVDARVNATAHDGGGACRGIRLRSSTNWRRDMGNNRISYVPLDEMDERMQAEIHRCAREGTPRPESSAVRAHAPNAFWAFADSWQALFNSGICDHAIKELCRVYVSRTVKCEYCGNQRSTRATAEGLAAQQYDAVLNFEASEEYDHRQRPRSPTPRRSAGDWSRLMTCGSAAWGVLRSGTGRTGLLHCTDAWPAKLDPAARNRPPRVPGWHGCGDGAGVPYCRRGGRKQDGAGLLGRAGGAVGRLPDLSCAPVLDLHVVLGRRGRGHGLNAAWHTASVRLSRQRDRPPGPVNSRRGWLNARDRGRCARHRINR